MPIIESDVVSEWRISAGGLSNNGMHPTADTLLVMLRGRVGAAGDAGRYAAVLQTRAWLRGARLAKTGCAACGLHRKLEAA